MDAHPEGGDSFDPHPPIRRDPDGKQAARGLRYGALTAVWQTVERGKVIPDVSIRHRAALTIEDVWSSPRPDDSRERS